MRLTPERVSIALNKTGAKIAQAAQLLRCTPQALYQFLDRHPELQRLREQIETDLLNRARDRVVQAIRDGDLEASVVYLSTKSKSKAITTKLAISDTENASR